MQLLCRNKLSALALLVALLLSGGCQQSSQLERIQHNGELLVATRLAPTTYYHGADGPAGLEHELISRFARQIGVRPRFVFPKDINTLIRSTRDGKVHMAAAGLTITPRRQGYLRFSRPFQEVAEQIVYKQGTRRPRSLAQIEDGQLHVIGKSSHVETLEILAAEHPTLTWTRRFNTSLNDLLKQVDAGSIPFTVSDSHELARAQRIYTHLMPALTIGEKQSLAWAFPAAGDDSLRQAADRFLEQLEKNGTLEILLERYYGHTERMNFVDRRDFHRHVRDRLPRYCQFFLEAADKTGYDWQLLAAIGYQESHWRPDAVSPTGVRGLMMLTQNTARQVGVKKRTDAQQSIRGGADYLKIVERKIPDRIQAPDRIWLALAGYNVGFGHLEDARVLTERHGANPDLWMDVKEHLPLLRKEKYHSTVRNGYARGEEPVNYVENIRNYYELLVWHQNNRTACEGPGDYSTASASIDRNT